jgi:hypothetical protein
MSATGGERRARLLSLLVGQTNSAFGAKRLCQACAEATAATGAGIMLMADDAPRGSLCTTNPMSDLIEQLQYALGEGPCVDAYMSGRPVSEPDLAAPTSVRWLAFSPPALDGGVRAVFGFPLQVGAVRLGALNLCRDRPGPLSDDHHADALAMAEITAQAVLVLQSGAPEGNLASELAAGADFHYVVHQASGMVAAQANLSVRDALARLRAYAFGHDRALSDVAKDVVARQLRFDPATEDEAL